MLALGVGAGAAEFKHQTIDDKIGIGYGLAIADVNGDKRADVLLVDAHEVAWYEAPSWKKHVITGKLTERDHVCIAAQDIDGDGKSEIAIGAQWNPGDTVGSGAVFMLKAPEDRTQKWTAIRLPHMPTVHRMWWVHDDAGRNSLLVSPLHGRGNKAGAGEGVKLMEYVPPKSISDIWSMKAPGQWEADASPDVAAPWRISVVEGTMHMTHNLDPIQWDGDRDQEVLYGGKEAIVVLDRGNPEWRKITIASAEKTPGFPGAGEVRLGKMASGRFIASIEPMHGTNAVVYTTDGVNWKRQVIDATLNDGHAVATGDLLKLGSDQVAIGWRGKDAKGKVGIRLFAQKNGQWQGSVVDDNQMACEDLKVADLNGDGWLDIVAAGRATKNVKIYWNAGDGGK